MQLGGMSSEDIFVMPTITGNVWEDLQPGEPTDMEPFNDRRPQLEDKSRNLTMFKGRAICRCAYSPATQLMARLVERQWFGPAAA